MSKAKCALLLLATLVVISAKAAESPDAQQSRNYGYGPALTEEGSTVLLIQIVPREKSDEGSGAYRAKVLADVRGKVKDDAVIRIGPKESGTFGDSGFPLAWEGDIEVWSVKEKADGRFLYQDQMALPFGVDAETRIAPGDVDKVKIAIKELRAALDAPEHAAPTRARADELLKEKNYYLWAMGAWCIARDANADDMKFLKDLLQSGDISLAQAMWLHRVLQPPISSREVPGAPSLDEVNSLLFSFLDGYVKRNPGSPGAVAPAPTPPIPQPHPLAIARTDWFEDAQFGDGKDHVVMVQVETVKKSVDKNENPFEITYKSKVVYDQSGGLTDHEITITGALGNLNDLDNVTVLAVGDTAIFWIKPTNDPNAFTTQGFAGTPFGLSSSMPIPKDDINDLLAAIKLVNTYLPIKDPKKTHAEAIKLLKDKNYYIWALGASLLAIEGTKENVQLLRASYSDNDQLTVTQFFWINCLLDSVFPKDSHPTCEQRSRDFEFYLQKHAKPVFR